MRKKPKTDRERLAELQAELEEVRASLPAHSVSAAHMMRMEELEEEIAALRTKLAQQKKKG